MSLSNTLLLTGFEPFGGHASNPSWDIAQRLQGSRIGPLTVHALQLPCVFGASAERLRQEVQALRPQVVVSLGLAASRHDISIERVALNVDDARIPDNRGAQPIDEPVVPGGPLAFASGLPIKRMAAALQQAGIAASVSQTAGTYVCNHVFYALMHAVQSSTLRAGFIHVPHTGPEWPLERLVQGIRLALEVAAAHIEPGEVDLRLAAGAVD